MTRALLLPMLAHLSVLTSAQEMFSADTAAARRFSAFEALVLAQPMRSGPAAALDEYCLVWLEHNNGYFTSVAPGDSTTTLASLLPAGRMVYPGGTMEDVTFHGERYAVLVRDVPVSMLNLTRWFFERRDQGPPSGE